MTRFQVLQSMQRAGGDPPVRTAEPVKDREHQAQIVPRDLTDTLRISRAHIHPVQLTAFA